MKTQQINQIPNSQAWHQAPYLSLAAAAAHIYDYSITPRSGAKRLHTMEWTHPPFKYGFKEPKWECYIHHL